MQCSYTLAVNTCISKGMYTEICSHNLVYIYSSPLKTRKPMAVTEGGMTMDIRLEHPNINIK